MMGSKHQVLTALRELAPRIAARAGEIEAERTVPLDIVEQLKGIGVFRTMTPKVHGGLELDFPDFLDVISEVAEMDGSIGWATIIGAGTPLLLSRLARPVFDRIYKAGPDIIQAGTIHALGTAETVSGGYRVTGRWPFASGAPHADWILGGCKITKDGKPLPGRVEGQALEKIVTLPAGEWQIEDTWYAGGLKGSGSHHVSLKDAFVPEEQCFDLAGPSCLPGPLFESVGAFIPFFHAALAIGIARGAYKDILSVAGAGRRQYRTRAPMREMPVFQYELGRANADLRAAQAFLKTQVDSHWQRAQERTLGEMNVFFEGMQMNAWVTEACTRVIDKCYTLGGSASPYDSSPLQRRLRDIHTATQHVATSWRHYMSYGAISVGLPGSY